MSNINCYEELEGALSSFIDEHELDDVTVNSLFRSSIEFLEPELQTATVVVLDAGKLDETKSIKASNVKIGIKFALGAIFAVKPMLTENGVWLVLLVLKAIVTLVGDHIVDLSREEAIILFAIYRLQSADEERILEYITSSLSVSHGIISKDRLDEGLKKLEKIRTIKLVDGKFVVNETVIIKGM